MPGTLVLQLVHDVAATADVSLRLRPASRALRATLAPTSALAGCWATLHRARRTWRKWCAQTAARRARVRSRMLRPVVISWYRTRASRTDETPVLVFAP